MDDPSQNRSEVQRVGESLAQGNDRAIQEYLAIVDDGEISRLAAMMAPKRKVFVARLLIGQAVALQAEASAELVRRRAAIVNSMNHVTLVKLAGQLGVGETELLHVLHEDNFTDPITGPALRRLVALQRAMFQYQDFKDCFLAEDTKAALSLAASRTTLPRPLPNATFEEILRYVANIPTETDEVSWTILEGAFLDFLRITCLYPEFPAEFIPEDSGAKVTNAQFSKILAKFEKHHEEMARFHDAFVPGQDFPPEIIEIADRAYAECWKFGILGPSWLRRLAWLVVEFPPFWDRHGDAYCTIHQGTKKTENAIKKAKSVEAKEKGKVGIQNREGGRWKAVTAEFIEYFKANSDGAAIENLQGCVTSFVGTCRSHKGKHARENELLVLRTFSDAVRWDSDAGSVLVKLQRSKFDRIKGREPEERDKWLAKLSQDQQDQYKERGTCPSDWLQFKSLTEEAVGDCLEHLKSALAKA